MRGKELWGHEVTVFNVVKFKVKAGKEAAFLAAHDNGKANWPGLQRGVMIRTGDQHFCLIGEWPSREVMVAARPAMVTTLGTFRDLLEEIAEGKGTTDAVSGEVVLSLT
jgi:hypothetical protein